MTIAFPIEANRDFDCSKAGRVPADEAETAGDMLTALVLVCSILVTPDLRTCDEKNARIVMRVPDEFSTPITCAMHGQAYLAQTALDLSKNDRMKVVCKHAPEEVLIAKGGPEKPTHVTGGRWKGGRGGKPTVMVQGRASSHPSYRNP